jgi:hypothetical protein
MDIIKRFEDFLNEEGYYEADYSTIPDNILDHWLYHYDLWCQENGQKPEFDSVEEIKDGDGIDHVYYHADIYAKKHGFKLDGFEYMEPEEITEKLITEGDHSEESEDIWFKALKLIGFDGMKEAAQECYPNRDFSWCETESDLWNELDFRGYFDEFCETFLVNRLPELESLTEGKVEDVQHIGNGLKYRNESFPGFNHPKKSDSGKYKFRVLARAGDKVKIINFGKVGEDKKQLSKLSKKYWESSWRY